MKRHCKNIDITDTKFIESAIWDCLKNRDRRDFNRSDIQRVIEQYGTIDKMAEKMSQEIKSHHLELPPTTRSVRIDKSNGKLRDIDVEDIWQQFYDYVAARALEPALVRLGYYQCGCVDGKGQIWGIQMLRGWMKKFKHFTHSDIRKCYPSIPQDKLFAFLRSIIKNNDLLWLIETLIRHTTKQGIPIGSRLSITLCQLYLSQLYHHMEGCYKIRRGKRKKLAQHTLIFMDDIYMTSNSASDLHKAEKELMRFSREELGLEIKPEWIMVDTANASLDAMGFSLNRDYVKMRRINYLRTKKALKKFEKNPCLKTAQSLMSRKTNIKYTDSYHFRKKYHWKEISKKARRMISDESKIHNQTGTCDPSYRWQYRLLPDRDECAGSDDKRPSDGRTV